ncbi:hypothetical protein KP77_27560 [Jeotgalibacillus alimentarius]|uniref:Glycosyltransferase RgtA/B/C/D-like domain-containing protein n=1 Tax=Jeotgalibacillus alimentarius TaxID=135826 RepID=A0A0C2RXX6_9BACL|nr:glucosyltransferase domain-containing protein [Jeotgalibacillus alimentarius]KIL46629.1 hypothetical protein KP77_27560 [Jeotgalibacillus alimentarius]
MPEDLLKWMKNHIRREWKIAFIAAAVIGFLTHMYVMTNTLPNHDGLINVYNTQEKFVSGRFFLSPLAGISSYFDLPWLIGALSILYLSLTAVFVTILFDLKKTMSIVIAAGMIAAFPTVGATFSYMFTADAYMLANLLTVIALVIAKKWRFGFIPAALIFFVSVGTYQANLTMLLVFAGVYLIKELLKKESTLKDFFIPLLRFSGVAVIGMGLYYVLFKVYQTFFAGQITNYQGLNEVGAGGESLRATLGKIKDSGLEFFFHGFVTDAFPRLYSLLNTGFFIVLTIGLILAVIYNQLYKQPAKLALLIGSLGALPFLTYLLYFVSPGVTYHMLMVMAISSIYLLPIIIYDQMTFAKRIPFTAKAYSWIAVLLISVIIYNFAVISNIAYFNMNLRYEKSFSTMNRVLDRMEQTEGYSELQQIGFIGAPDIRSNLGIKVWKSIPEMTGAMGDSFIAHPPHMEYMLNTYFGEDYYLISDYTLEEFKAMPEVQEMPVWPEEGSIQLVDNTLIVKFADYE